RRPHDRPQPAAPSFCQRGVSPTAASRSAPIKPKWRNPVLVSGRPLLDSPLRGPAAAPAEPHTALRGVARKPQSARGELPIYTAASRAVEVSLPEYQAPTMRNAISCRWFASLQAHTRWDERPFRQPAETAAVPLPALRGLGDDWPQLRRDRLRAHTHERAAGLIDLEHDADLFPARRAQPSAGHVTVVVRLHHVQPRRAVDRRLRSCRRAALPLGRRRLRGPPS